MVDWKTRPKSKNIEDRRDELANLVLDSMRGSAPKKRNTTWDMMMSPTPIAPTSMKFEPRMTVGENYQYESFKKGKK